MPTISERLAAARLVSSDIDPLVHYERSALLHLERHGIVSLGEVLHIEGSDRWSVWAADSIVFTIDALRAGRHREALRGWGQVREYHGRYGGFLPAGLSDARDGLQNALEALLQRAP
jgi:hypothetical protein